MLLLLLALSALLLLPASTLPITTVSDCDVLIVGGNLGGVAAALSAADAAPALQVCYTDLTDWPGGQASTFTSPLYMCPQARTLTPNPKSPHKPSPNSGGRHLRD